MSVGRPAPVGEGAGSSGAAGIPRGLPMWAQAQHRVMGTSWAGGGLLHKGALSWGVCLLLLSSCW